MIHLHVNHMRSRRAIILSVSSQYLGEAVSASTIWCAKLSLHYLPLLSRRYSSVLLKIYGSSFQTTQQKRGGARITILAAPLLKNKTLAGSQQLHLFVF